MSAVFLDEMGHLWSEDRDVLHVFAASIGMKRSWFQDRPVLYHYDLMAESKRRLARRAGAIAVTSRSLVRMMQGAQLLRADRQEATDA